jgi:hypothetical protein
MGIVSARCLFCLKLIFVFLVKMPVSFVHLLLSESQVESRVSGYIIFGPVQLKPVFFFSYLLIAFSSFVL